MRRLLRTVPNRREFPSFAQDTRPQYSSEHGIIFGELEHLSSWLGDQRERPRAECDGAEMHSARKRRGWREKSRLRKAAACTGCPRPSATALPARGPIGGGYALVDERYQIAGVNDGESGHNPWSANSASSDWLKSAGKLSIEPIRSAMSSSEAGRSFARTPALPSRSRTTSDLEVIMRSRQLGLDLRRERLRQPDSKGFHVLNAVHRLTSLAIPRCLLTSLGSPRSRASGAAARCDSQRRTRRSQCRPTR